MEWHREIFCLDGERAETTIYTVRDGFYYHFSWRRGQSIYLKCIFSKSKDFPCPGRAIINIRLGLRHSQGHVHEADPWLEDVKVLRANVLERCRRLETTSFKDILLQERSRFDREVQLRLPYVKLRHSMLRARRANYPAMPHTLQELTNVLLDPQYEVITQTLDGQENIFAGSVQTADGHTHVVFSSMRLLRILRRCEYIFSDGTFKVKPSMESLNNRRAQVFVIVTSWRGHTLPVAWALMENRTQEAYEAVLQLINLKLNGRVNINIVVTDDEPAQHNAWGNVFNVTLQDCLFHMCRCFVLKLFALGLGRHFYNNLAPQFMEVVRLACALPLLPRRYLTLGWRCVKREARRIGGQMLRDLLNPFFIYLWDEYVGNDRKKARMSVFGSDHRTNNCCESMNSLFLLKFGLHPSIYDFIQGSLEIEDQAYLDYLTLQRGFQASRSRKTSAIMNDAALLNLGRDLLNAPLGNVVAVTHYLRAASYRVQGLIRQFAELDQ